MQIDYQERIPNNVDLGESRRLQWADICAANGMDWGKLLVELREAGRYHVETYF